MSLVGIDAAISPQQSVVNTVRKFVRGGKIMSLAHLSGIDAEVIEVEVTADSRVAGKSVRDAGMPKDSILTAIIRDGELVVATGDAVICEGDQVVIFALPDAIMKVDSLFS
jgi:trk system potassium uptake protein TrkA